MPCDIRGPFAAESSDCWRRFGSSFQRRSEPLLQLRCIELNGDWDDFLDWVDE
jgi:hypothetical protein